jgi:hypothetical protein
MPMSAPDQMDEMLREFFRREVPSPWPPWRLPESTGRLNSSVNRPLRRSRLMLVASLVLLLAGLSLTSAMLRGVSPAAPALPPDAKRPGSPLYHKPPATLPDKHVAPKIDEESKPFESPLSRLPR